MNYNAEQIRDHFDRDYLRQVSRLTEIAFGFLPLANKLLMDKLTGRPYEEVEIERAAELRTILTRLGPTFIKVGQAVSIRPDILPRETMYELQKLCDDVPRFSNELARQIFKDELGKDFDEVFTDIQPEPVAAASIGQVYKAKLRTTGEDVAIKVQRPAILETVSLDLCLIRKVCELL